MKKQCFQILVYKNPTCWIRVKKESILTLPSSYSEAKRERERERPPEQTGETKIHRPVLDQQETRTYTHPDTHWHIYRWAVMHRASYKLHFLSGSVPFFLDKRSKSQHCTTQRRLQQPLLPVRQCSQNTHTHTQSVDCSGMQLYLWGMRSGMKNKVNYYEPGTGNKYRKLFRTQTANESSSRTSVQWNGSNCVLLSIAQSCGNKLSVCVSVCVCAWGLLFAAPSLWLLCSIIKLASSTAETLMSLLTQMNCCAMLHCCTTLICSNYCASLHEKENHTSAFLFLSHINNYIIWISHELPADFCLSVPVIYRKNIIL